ncbi:MAG TPA: PPE family protein [Mycobacterium sp.]|nr:PPE family protein [Mycobacterium sp.]HME78786.1 PPE family protein [Mycobacterium sp.]
MLDFGALPPEINSGLMYTGPGSGPMLTASMAWNALADNLYSTAISYGSVISDLTASWLGPSSMSMAAAAAPYVSWISTTAAQAEAAAAQAMAAVAAYEAAFAMTVPPAVIAANRALLLMLVATNFFGQNTPAIMATEAEYVEMWAQDATAMYGYAGAAAAASTLIPFATPVETTSPSGLGGLAAAVTQAATTSAGTGVQVVSQLTSALSTPLSSVLSTPLSSAAMPTAVQGLASAVSVTSSTSSTSPLSTLSTLSTSSTAVTSGTSLVSGIASPASMLGSAASVMNSIGPTTSAFGRGFQVFGSALNPSLGSGAGAFSSTGMGETAVTAGVGRAATLGALSVPQGWASAAPAFSQVSSALPGATGGLGAAPPVAPGAPAGPLGAPTANTAARGGTSSPLAARYNVRPAVVQRPLSAG